MKTVLSGIRPTGNLHLGNYYGALRNFIKMQESEQCFFFIADLHSLTTHPKPEDFHGNVMQIMAEYLAAGLDSDKCTLYVQSDVPEISEMCILLNMQAYVGELERTASFKEKVRLHPNNVNAGLLTYPVLMASDILAHRAHYVPVGKDQEQHLELTRVFARRFNNFYGATLFPEPEAYNFGHELIKIPGLDGSGKMGKSEGNGIFLTDDEASIHKKVKKAVTDTGEKVGTEMSEPVKNLFTIMTAVSTPEVVAFYRNAYDNGAIRYGDMKKQLADDICSVTQPIRTRINELVRDENFLHQVRLKGAAKARASAASTLGEMKKLMGFRTI
ncbi:MAG: tryptophan--tRNA ligase [Prevotellaceae bacterium]|jgi:tryptophanyl-tRNA synthetase|nr:tryptophan--tRNA ligase [Prevotellaceae bacterium]